MSSPTTLVAARAIDRIDLIAATRFIDLMAEGEPVTFQTFDDSELKRKSFARILHGTLEQHAAELARLNADGAGIFWMVNYGDSKGRTAENVTGIRALFADLDGAPLDPARDALEPHVIVESSPGRWHVYWLVADCPIEKFTDLQKKISARFGSDPKVHDLPRVMRLPGFLHRKETPFQSRIAFLEQFYPYPVEEIISKLGLSQAIPPNTAKPAAAVAGTIPDHERNVTLASLAGSMRKRGMTAAEIAIALGAVNKNRCVPPLTDDEVREIAKSVSRYQPKDEPPKADQTTTEWHFLDLEALAEHEPQPPQSIMEGVPIGYAIGSFGHGGAGKSQIELMRAVCIAAGVPFCGFEVQRRRVMFLSCEDRADILHWRLSRICKHLRVSLASLRGWLEIVDLVGHDSLLFATDPRTGNSFTAAYGTLAEQMQKHGTDILVADSITDVYGDNENARGPIKRFINSGLALIPAETGALILIGHVNRMTAASNSTTEGYSGSTAWHNSCRARWYLYPETEQDDDGQHGRRTGKLIFELQKSNHGEIGTQIEFEWDDDAHLFIGRQVGNSRFDRQHQQREERRGTLRALQASGAVPSATTGQRTAYHVLSARPEFPESLRKGKASVRRFWRHIEELRAMGHICEGSIRRKDRHLVSTLELTPEGLRACGQ